MSVYPFIINGISLLGVATAENPLEHKKAIWDNLANQWKVSQLHQMKRVVSLEQVSDEVDKMLAGKAQGRVVVHH